MDEPIYQEIDEFQIPANLDLQRQTSTAPPDLPARPSLLQRLASTASPDLPARPSLLRRFWRGRRENPTRTSEVDDLLSLQRHTVSCAASSSLSTEQGKGDKGSSLSTEQGKGDKGSSLSTEQGNVDKGSSEGIVDGDGRTGKYNNQKLAEWTPVYGNDIDGINVVNVATDVDANDVPRRRDPDPIYSNDIDCIGVVAVDVDAGNNVPSRRGPDPMYGSDVDCSDVVATNKESDQRPSELGPEPVYGNDIDGVRVCAIDSSLAESRLAVQYFSGIRSTDDTKSGRRREEHEVAAYDNNVESSRSNRDRHDIEIYDDRWLKIPERFLVRCAKVLIAMIACSFITVVILVVLRYG